ncbi:two pore domain potassium channel family protein [Candidatus Woesearchaeota archaeon]|nr:two pore domain potassium channel family protein [Candidatus Woesearchaeota archaeon]
MLHRVVAAMKRPHLETLFNDITEKGINRWFSRLTFFNIFLVWTTIIAIFGVVYFYAANEHAHLIYSANKAPVDNLMDNVYFSFITATSTGFGDIIPVGFFKAVAIAEVIFGLLLLAFVTSKLISIKQDIILSEIYEISFNEKINRLRSSLMVFRQNINRLIARTEEGNIHKREAQDIYLYLSTLEDTLTEIDSITESREGSMFKKVIDPINLEILLNSITQSWERLEEFIALADQKSLEWRREVTLLLLHKCAEITSNLLIKLNQGKSLNERAASDIGVRQKKIFSAIEAAMKRDAAKQSAPISNPL